MSGQQSGEFRASPPPFELVRLQTRGGYQFFMPDGMVPSQQRAIETDGAYERATELAIQHFARPGMNALECGANCGYHTLNLARAVSPGGCVYVYEANPELIGVIEQNVRTNDFSEVVEVHHQGVWDTETVLPFPIRRRSLGGAGLKPKFRNPLRRWKARGKVKRYIELQVVTLEAMCRGRDIDLIRMDVEGAEFEAIHGSTTYLRSHDPSIILEWIPRPANRARTLQLFETLTELGFTVARISPEGLLRIDSGEEFHDAHAELWKAGHSDVLCQKAPLSEKQTPWER